jgi:hypothetical protein
LLVLAVALKDVDTVVVAVTVTLHALPPLTHVRRTPGTVKDPERLALAAFARAPFGSVNLAASTAWLGVWVVFGPAEVLGEGPADPPPSLGSPEASAKRGSAAAVQDGCCTSPLCVWARIAAFGSLPFSRLAGIDQMPWPQSVHGLPSGKKLASVKTIRSIPTAHPKLETPDICGLPLLAADPDLKGLKERDLLTRSRDLQPATLCHRGQTSAYGVAATVDDSSWVVCPTT